MTKFDRLHTREEKLIESEKYYAFDAAMKN